MTSIFSDYGAWMNLLKSNYRKGAGALRGILGDNEAASQMVQQKAAVMAIYGDVNYADGSSLCADVIGQTEYSKPAFNLYLKMRGLTTHDTWEETAADTEVIRSLVGTNVISVISNSPALLTATHRDLNSDSWSDISNYGKQGLHNIFYALGDTKDIELDGIGTMTLEIADFDHDYLSGSMDAERAPFTFLTKNLLYSNYQMNTSNSNTGGFNSMPLRTTLNSTIYNALPSDLKNIIRTTYKWYGIGNGATNGSWQGYKLWIPLEGELFPERHYAPETEWTNGARLYPIFTDNASRVKKMNNGTGSAYHYWLASPYATDATGFCIVSSSGSCNIYGASNSFGVCFGLTV